MDFIASYLVSVPIVRPIRASDGNLLVVWPANPSRTLIVHADRPGFPVLRYAVVEMGLLYGLVLNWELDGIITPLTPASSLAARLGSLQPPRQQRA